MKYSFLGLGFIMFGIFGLIFIIMFQSISVNNESEYYVLKEAMEASMLEAVDLACYRMGDVDGNILVDTDGDGIGESTVKGACGYNDLKIIEQKFVENFTRRFAASISGDVTEYELLFYDIIESPPKATVVIKAKTQEYMLGSKDAKQSFTIVNELSGILELHNVTEEKILNKQIGSIDENSNLIGFK